MHLRMHASREYLVMFWRFLPPSTPPVAKWIGTPLTKVTSFLQSFDNPVPSLCQVPLPGCPALLTAKLWFFSVLATARHPAPPIRIVRTFTIMCCTLRVTMQVTAL